jgi:hypothetical protein
VAAGIALIAPLRSPDGMHGVLVADERLDGRDLERCDLDVMAMLCDTAALALANVRRCASQAVVLLDQLDAMATHELGAARRAPECAAANAVIAAATGLRPPSLELVARAIRLGPWAEAAGSEALLALAARDASGTARRLRGLVERAALEGAASDDLDGEARAAVQLIRFGRALAAALRAGADLAAALDDALGREGEALGEPLASRLRSSVATRGDAPASASRSR